MEVACCYFDSGCSFFSLVLKMFWSYGKIQPIICLLLNGRKNALFKLFSAFLPVLSHFSDRCPKRTHCIVVLFQGYIFAFAHLGSCFDLRFLGCLETLFGMVTAAFCLLVQLLLRLAVQCCWPSKYVSGCSHCFGSGKVLHLETKHCCLPLHSYMERHFISYYDNVASSRIYKLEGKKNSTSNSKKGNVHNKSRFK